MDEQLFGLLGIDPKSARERAFTRGLLSTIFNAASLAGPQARPTSGIQALGQLGLGAMEAYESSFDKTLKDALSNIQVRGTLQQLSDSQTKRSRQQKVQEALTLPTIQEQVQALQRIGAYDEIKGLAEAQKLLRQSGVMRQPGEAPEISPFTSFLQSPSPQVRDLAQTYEQGFREGRITEDVADKRILDLARIEDRFVSEQRSAQERASAREESRAERALTREMTQQEREIKREEGTEGQKLSAGFASRMEASNAIIEQLEPIGGLPTVGTSIAGGVPFIGGYLQRKAMTPEQQRYKQAADNWIRANLRKESGAAIGEGEMAQEYATYFPMPGDDPDTIAQKAEARRITTQAMIQNAGPVYRPTSGAKRPRTSPKDVKNKYGLE